MLVSKFGTDILELVDQVVKNPQSGSYQLAQIRKGSQEVIRQCKYMVQRLSAKESNSREEENRLHREIGAYETSIFSFQAEVSQLKAQLAGEQAKLNACRRELSSAEHALSMAKKKEEKADDRATNAGVAAVVLGILFPPSLIVTVPVAVVMGAVANAHTERVKDRRRDVRYAESSVSRARSSIKSKNDSISCQQSKVSDLRQLWNESRSKQKEIRDIVYYICQATTFFEELEMATKCSDKSTDRLKTLIDDFNQRESRPYPLGLTTITRGFQDSWENVAEHLRQGERFLNENHDAIMQ